MLTDEQSALLDAVQAILRDHAELSVAHRTGAYFYDAKLQGLLEEAGFMNVEGEIGSLEAALIAIEVAKLSPSSGICDVPPIAPDACNPIKSSKVGTRSQAWTN